ncbi:MAG: TonB family protein [Fibrobacter sp.]|nr:TonB family protein [Fibrobacter sp.]
MTRENIYSALSFNKAFCIGLVVAFFVHLALFLNPLFELKKVAVTPSDSPVLHAERVVLIPPPEPPRVVKKVVRAKVIPKVVETPIKEKEPEPEQTLESAPVAAAEPMIETPQTLPVVNEDPKPSKDSIQKVVKAYLGSLKKQLEKRKSYPSTARRLKQEGTVRLRFTIQEDGRIDAVEISKSSRYSALDKSALDAVENLGRFLPIPGVLNKKSWRIEIPIQYKLNPGRS